MLFATADSDLPNSVDHLHVVSNAVECTKVGVVQSHQMATGNSVICVGNESWNKVTDGGAVDTRFYVGWEEEYRSNSPSLTDGQELLFAYANRGTCVDGLACKGSDTYRRCYQERSRQGDRIHSGSVRQSRPAF